MSKGELLGPVSDYKNMTNAEFISALDRDLLYAELEVE